MVDEFHHAVNDSYMKIISYFKYQFLLGLTATPDRMDGRNIYEICDYNVPFKITLKDAINKGMLVPFRYYGIYDGVDYSGLPVVRGKYLQKDLDIKLIVKERCDLIYKNYKKYGSRRALGFCCSRVHAEKMAEEFCARNIPACAVYSDSDGNFSEDRTAAIEKLEKGEISVIFQWICLTKVWIFLHWIWLCFSALRNHLWFFFSSWAGDCGKRLVKSI